MKSMFAPEEPVVHIAVVDKKGDQMWNGVQTGNDGMSDHWNRVDGQKLSLFTYTNADEVELMQNGKSLGKKPNDVKNPKARNQIRWTDVVYQPGTLEAIAYRNGKVVARHKIETTGEAVQLKAVADRTAVATKKPAADAWCADGMDLLHVKVQAFDKKGRLVQTATQEVSFNVEGCAEIVGVINGDINSNEMTVGNKRSLYNGTCTVILRSKLQGGPVVLTASAPGLKGAKLKLQVKE
jgi:beta-galactosidase